MNSKDPNFAYLSAFLSNNDFKKLDSVYSQKNKIYQYDPEKPYD